MPGHFICLRWSSSGEVHLVGVRIHDVPDFFISTLYCSWFNWDNNSFLYLLSQTRYFYTICRQNKNKNYGLSKTKIKS